MSLCAGVYAVGWPQMTKRRRWMVAVLACGEGAVLSHCSAAALWGIGEERNGRIDVSIRRRSELKRPGLRVRARAKLDPARIAVKDGIPLTDVVQTLVDLATELPSRRVERAINEADKHDLVDPETLRCRLGGYEGEPGVKPLRTLLDKRTFRLSDSDLEIFFRPIASAAGLPPPLSQQVVNGWEVDFYWPDLGLIVETDGLRYHRTASTQTRDVRRDRAHALAGKTPLRFTHYEVKYEPTQVRQELKRAAAMLQARVSEIDHT
jgi:uncharacterized protein DUF559